MKNTLVNLLNEILQKRKESEEAQKKIENLNKLFISLDGDVEALEDELCEKFKIYLKGSKTSEIYLKDKNLDVYKLSIENNYLTVKKIQII